MGVALKHITDPVPEILKVNPDLPQETDTIIKTAMAKKKEDRYPSVTELAKAFNLAAKSDAGAALPPDTSRAAASPFSNNRLVLIVAGVFVFGAVILLTVIMGIFFKSRFSSQSQPTPAVDATVHPVAASTAGSFTEEFDGTLDANWKYFITGGPESQLTSSIQNGFMNFDIAGGNLRYYAYYAPKTYANVRVDARAENLGDSNSSVLILCRYNESKGWYEFRINSGGLYEILYSTLNADKIHVSSSRIANGGSNLIKVGKAVNEYSVTCSGRTLSLSVNGSLVKSVDDNQFLLEDGYAGFGAMSEKVPVQIGIDSVGVSQP
jgi:hypothetical protein